MANGIRMLLNFFVILVSWRFHSAIASVSYDHRALVLNGQRRILFSGSIHYPRSTPEMWPDLINKAKEGGLDVIQTYVFWNGHEPMPGKFNFEGRYDLVRFIKLVQQSGLYLHLRIGPYVCAEWNFGGFPVWLKYIPGISFRTDNAPFKREMQRFTMKIVNMMKEEKLFASQGGPVIMSQIENEYDLVEYSIGKPGKLYADWAASMAVDLETGVPWVMCKQQDAPDPVINTCNGFYCQGFKPNKQNKPMIWTENWTGWFTSFGGAVPYRPVEDLAYSVAMFIQNGGSFVNYYMYHGGTNFGRTAGGPFIATSYDYDAPIDEYGLLREPKWGHLRDLHKVISLCEPMLVSIDPSVVSIGNKQNAYIFESKAGCAAFLANNDPTSAVTVRFRNGRYELPSWSVSILPDCRNVAFNTAKVAAQTTLMEMEEVGDIAWSWNSYKEETPSTDTADAIPTTQLLEQINITRDQTDYLWYMTDVHINSDESFLKNGRNPELVVMSAGHALMVFINGAYVGNAYGGAGNSKLTFSGSVKLNGGVNKISLLSIAVGLPNIGLHFEMWNTGILGPVTLRGLNEGERDLSSQKWSYKIGLKGEALALHSTTGSSSVEWIHGSNLHKNQPLSWYMSSFNAPTGTEPLALDMTSMGKGQIWINGKSIGRYWPRYIAKGNCQSCSYRGTFNEEKCGRGCGESSQRWYHLPRAWLKPRGNLLSVFEELGGDPERILFVKRKKARICAEIEEDQPSMSMWHTHSRNSTKSPKAHLQCDEGQKISKIKFASFGNSMGECGNYKQGSCHAPKSYAALQKNCVGKQSCFVTVSARVFGGDPCPYTAKKLSIEALCS